MRLVEHFFELIAPHDCLACGSEGPLLCKRCAGKLLAPLPGRCYRCSTPSLNSQTCLSCSRTAPLAHVWSRTKYNLAARALVHRLKFNFAKAAAATIAAETTPLLPTFDANTLLVHIPAASSRIRQRGYDQSALIARELSRRTPYLHAHALKRVGQLRQVGADRTTRLTQLKDVFRVVSPEVVRGAHIILVDDVFTTGGTLEAAAWALRKAGAKQVDAVTFAHAV